MIVIQIKIADWLFDVDLESSMRYSSFQAKDHCMCGYCRNFYQTLDQFYPNVRPFLSKFGIDPEGPDELCPFEPTIYEASYIVQGTILQRGAVSLYVDRIPVTCLDMSDCDIYTEHAKPYFVLQLGLMDLPWLLAEAADEVISPANEPEFLQRMQEKLLQKLEDTQYQS